MSDTKRIPDYTNAELGLASYITFNGRRFVVTLEDTDAGEMVPMAEAFISRYQADLVAQRAVAG